MTDQIQGLLQDIFGYEAFRSGQEQVIAPLLEGRNVLAVMPTGFGKSLCYQLPAIALPKYALVISPLVALMKDQIDELKRLGVRAVCINSSQTDEEQNAAWNSIYKKELDLLYITPERFRSSRFLETVKNAPPSFVAIDEAHCVSEWGHDFRPDYLKLKEAIIAMGSPPVGAFTATATPDIRNDILKQLGLNNQNTDVVVSGLDRENLAFMVNRVKRLKDKTTIIKKFLKTEKGAGIIYAGTRKACDEICAELKSAKISVGVYHAGLSPKVRTQMQDKFINNELQVIVATNAFGMGIDKSNIRFVIHYSIPSTIEAYYQEAGRAGRDSRPARCLLLWNASDKRLREFFIDTTFPSRDILQEVYTVLQNQNENIITLSADDIAEKCTSKVHPLAVASAVRILEFANVLSIENSASQTHIQANDLSKNFLSLPIDWQHIAHRRKNDTEKLNSMIGYANTTRCRTSHILTYFGENEISCMRCDACVNSNSDINTLEETSSLGREISNDACVLILKLVQELEPRKIGRTTVAQILAGSSAAFMTKRGYKKLNSYNAMNSYTQDEVKNFVEDVIAEGLLKVKSVGLGQRTYPVLFLTQDGYAKLNEGSKNTKVDTDDFDSPFDEDLTPEPVKEAVVEKTIDLAIEENFIQPSYIDEDISQEPIEDNEELETLGNALLQLREELSKEHKTLPSVIFQDLSLHALCEKKPTSEIDLEQIPGMSPKRIRLHGERILNCIANICGNETPQIKEEATYNVFEWWDRWVNITPETNTVVIAPQDVASWWEAKNCITHILPPQKDALKKFWASSIDLICIDNAEELTINADEWWKIASEVIKPSGISVMRISTSHIHRLPSLLRVATTNNFTLSGIDESKEDIFLCLKKS